MALREKSIKKAYPLDSSPSPVSFDENGAPVYDREYNASDIRKTYARYFSDGVFTAVGEKLLVKRSGGTWYVHPGSAMCAGLRIDLDERTPVVDQADITPGKYAYVCVEARFDLPLNDGHVYARLSSSPTERPVRTASNHEVILARINWDGAITDLRLDNGYCGPVRFLFDVDTDNFVDALETKLGQFDLSVGLVEALARRAALRHGHQAHRPGRPDRGGLRPAAGPHRPQGRDRRDRPQGRHRPARGGSGHGRVPLDHLDQRGAQQRRDDRDQQDQEFHIPDKRESSRQKRVGSRARHVLRAGDMHQRQLDKRCG